MMLVAASIVIALPTYADEPTAADVEKAPPPGQESGRTDAGEQDSVLRDVGQGVLLPPKLALEVAFAPVRAGVWAYERFQVLDRFKQIFFDDTYTYGLYPTVVVDSTYGVTFGSRFVHRNVFGEREHLALRGAIGGEYRMLVDGGFRTGDRFGRVKLELRGEAERRPADNFYGIGNNVEEVEARHRQSIERGVVTADIRAVSDFHVALAGALTDLAYARSDSGMPIDMLYSPLTLTGWDQGVRNEYGEVELRWDSRRLADDFDTHATYDRGWLLSAYGGRLHQLQAGHDYWRYGGEIQNFVRLGPGPRVLGTRIRTEAVTGSYSDVAFTQLPQLGGAYLMRGYPRERFRDRLSIVTTAEYEWDLSRWLMASLFVDVGRVYPAWGELHYENLRVGYGVSVQLHSGQQFVSSLQLASSIDGGLFIDFVFDPVFDVAPRVREK